MEKSRAQLHAVMVFGQYGHRHCFYPAPQSAVQWSLALLDLSCRLLSEHSSLHHLHDH